MSFMISLAFFLKLFQFSHFSLTINLTTNSNVSSLISKSSASFLILDVSSFTF